MTLSKSNRNRRKKNFIFRGKSKKTGRRQLLEATLFLAIGINLILFLQTLPSDFVSERISKEIWIQLYEAFVTCLYSLAGIGVASIVICLLILSLTLVIGGIIRLIIFFTNRKFNFSRRKDIKP